MNLKDQLLKYFKIIPTSCTICGQFTPENKQVWIENKGVIDKNKELEMRCVNCYKP